MLGESSGPLPNKQSIFSPGRSKDRTPVKRFGRDKTPSKTEAVNQRSALRKAYRSSSKEGAIASQITSGNKREGAIPVDAPYNENKDVSDEVKRLTRIINEKQKLIVGITKKLGEFIINFRDIRASLDQLKEIRDIAEDIETLEK